MNFNIVFWNVRGLNGGANRTRIRNLLHLWNANVVCLQETKLAVVT
jgi:exonuclease III